MTTFFLILPTPALATPEDWPKFEQIIAGLQPLVTLVEQAQKNLQMLQTSNNMISQVQAGIRTIQDIQTFTLKQQSGASPGELIEYKDYINQQRTNNANLSRSVNSYGIVRMYLWIDTGANVQTIGWDNIDTLMTVLANLDKQTLKDTMAADWNGMELTISEYDRQETLLKDNQLRTLQQHWADYQTQTIVMSTGQIDPASVAALASKSVYYDANTVNATDLRIRNESQIEHNRLTTMKNKVIGIKQAVYNIQQAQYDKAILESQKVLQNKQVTTNKGQYIERAMGLVD